MNLSETILMKKLTTNSSMYHAILNLEESVKTHLERIPVIFPTFTSHDINHSIRVIEYMGEITENLTLSDLEIALMVLSGLFHDIGMYVSDEDIKKIKTNNIPGVNVDYKSVLSKFATDELSVQYIIRAYHPLFSQKFIMNDKNIFCYTEKKGIDENLLLSKIVFSHGQSIKWIEDNLDISTIIGRYTVKPILIAYLLRLADLLDFDRQRVPFNIYESLDLGDISKQEWDKHLSISNTKRIEKFHGIRKIVFTGECRHPNIHRGLLSYFENIEFELSNVTRSLHRLYEGEINLNLSNEIDNKIKTIDFSFSDLKLSFDFNAVTNLLMGEKIYSSKKIGLREVIQNSIDATLVKAEIVNKKLQLGEEKYVPIIKLIINKNDNTVCIQDNGIGMNYDIITQYFLNIGKSYYSSSEYRFQGLKYSPIGNFGIGFLACFMLSDRVKIETSRYNETNKIYIDMIRNSKFIVMNIENSYFEGTKLTFDYESFMKVFDYDVYSIKTFIEQYFITTNIDIRIIDSQIGHIKINNEINRSNIKAKIIIDAKDILKNVEGYIGISYESLLSHYQDVNSFFPCEYSYVHGMDSYEVFEGGLNSYGFYTVFETLSKLSDQILNDSISYLEIPLFCKEVDNIIDDLQQYNSDIEDIIYKVNDIKWIRVFTKEINMNFEEGINIVSDEEFIFGDITYNNFKNIFEEENESNRLVFLRKLDVYYKNDISSIINLEPISFYNRVKSKVFLKRVLIPNFSLEYSEFPSAITITNVLLNITDNDVKTNVSRVGLGDSENEELLIALKYGIVKYLASNLNLPNNEKNIISDYANNICITNNRFILY